jgi:hypothetical protein
MGGKTGSPVLPRYSSDYQLVQKIWYLHISLVLTYQLKFNPSHLGGKKCEIVISTLKRKNIVAIKHKLKNFNPIK